MSLFSPHFPSLPLLLLPLLLLIISFATPSSSASSVVAFIFGGCSRAKFTPASAYESAVNSVLTSIVNAAMFSSYNNLTVPLSSSQDTPIYGLFQCRGDLAAADCSRCVGQAVSQLGTLCPDSTGGALQLDGCFVKYDNSKFLGVEDKTLVLRKCGPSLGFTSDELTRRDAVLVYLETSDGMYKTFRTTSSGDFQGVAQCVGDLSATECQDCLSNAIGRLRVECGPAQWAQVYLAKCYARYSKGGDYSPGGNGEHKNKNDDELQKTLAIIVGLIAGVALLIIFISFLTKLFKKDRDGK
ncbi:plasmodesmata-located protein 6-like [Prosopis cineraria]|uniref:plasmodesmata-located protein 6-like n=1 Tax=Prosopis cineraria TaxID=364024 RepID=UPI00240FB9F7|nr:plasmodesmata-located protein 6-like [Prosopis cineraria]